MALADRSVVAAGFGLIPLSAGLLSSFAGQVTRNREAVWGLLAGIVAFLGLSHAMASVLVNHSVLGFDPAVATSVPSVGLVIGPAVAWLPFQGTFRGPAPNRIPATPLAFPGRHRLAHVDGTAAGFLPGRR